MADYDRVLKELEKAIRDSIKSETLLKIAKDLPERIKVRTRLGYGVDETGGPRQKLKDTKASTKRRKEYKKRAGDLSDQTTPKRSNLTDTGELLDSLVAESPKDGELTIKSKGARNEKVARYVTEGGRPFLNLSKPELRAFLDAFGKELIARIEKALK